MCLGSGGRWATSLRWPLLRCGGHHAEVAEIMERWFLNRLCRRIHVDSALRAREQAMVTFSIAFWGFWVTVSRAGAEAGSLRSMVLSGTGSYRQSRGGGGWEASVPSGCRVQGILASGTPFINGDRRQSGGDEGYNDVLDHLTFILYLSIGWRNAVGRKLAGTVV